MSNSQKKFIVSIPEASKLCRIKCQPQFERIMNSICKTNYHANVLTCRLVINELSETIAAPSNVGFTVIIPAESAVIEKLKNYLKNICVEFDTERPVGRAEYEKCLKYTIEFKMSPSWNKLGSYLIYGKNFLLKEINEISAINYNLSVEKDEFLLEIHQLVLKKNTAKLNGMINPSLLQSFMSNPKGEINFHQIKNIPVFVSVIPSLQRARIIAVSKQIPEDCPFATYNDIYSHWKNMYGYILPKNSLETFYYKVSFPFFPNKTFCYPSMCVFHTPPYVLPDKFPSLNLNETFFMNFRQSVTEICGHQVAILDQENHRGNVNMQSQTFTPSSQLSAVKKVMLQEPLSGKFTFDVPRLDSKDKKMSQQLKGAEMSTVRAESSTSTKNLNGEDVKSIIAKSSLKRPWSSQKSQSFSKGAHKLVVPNTPHISQYFQEKKFKITSIKGFEMGGEVGRSSKKSPECQETQMLKPICSGAEITRKNSS